MCLGGLVKMCSTKQDQADISILVVGPKFWPSFHLLVC